MPTRQTPTAHCCLGVLFGLVAAAAAQGGTCRRGENISVPKIRGGSNAPVCRFSYMVSLRDPKGTHQCGGELVHPRWVLTAAHCVNPGAKSSLTASPIVAVGPYFVLDDDSAPGVKLMRGKGFPHPAFDGNIENGSDIALIKLPEEVEYTPIPFAPSNYVLHSNEETVALGWGKGYEEADEKLPLQMVSLVALSNKKCKKALGKAFKANMICASSPTGDTCKGDSGGPLIVPHTPKSRLENGNPSLDLLVGLVSFGQGDCEGAVKPGVYTKVADFADWIESTIAEKTEPPTTTTTAPTTPDPTPGDEEVDPPAGDDPVEQSTITGKIAGGICASRSTESKSSGSIDQQMVDAVCENDSDQISSLVQKGADPSATEGRGTTALHIAAQNGFLEATKVLLAAAAKVDAITFDGWTPLHNASYQGHLDVAKALVAAGADIEAETIFENTSLLLASAGGHTQVAKFLIEAGANVRARDLNGWRPIIYASSQGNLDLVLLLLNNGASEEDFDDRRWRAIHYAASLGNVDLVKVLILNGASTIRSTSSGQKAVDLIPPNSPNKAELTTLLG